MTDVNKAEEIVNGPHTFKVVQEQTRTYFYPTGSITIDGVESINVSPSGTHRINLVNGKKRIMPSGWLSIEFDAPKWSF